MKINNNFLSTTFTKDRMKKIQLLVLLLVGNLQADTQTYTWEPLAELLDEQELNEAQFRVPPPPSTLGAPIGALEFQGYNGGSPQFTQGANVGGYSALPTPTTPTPNQTFPANVIISTIASSGGTSLPRLNVNAVGNVGIGNFAPTDTTLANAVLNIEGDTVTGAGTSMHIGSRTTGLTGFTSMTGSTGVLYNEQVDGNLLVNTHTYVNNATESTFNLLPATYIYPANVTTSTFVISTPGVYYLAGNINFAPASGIPAISITSSNVVLDFQSYAITKQMQQHLLIVLILVVGLLT